MLAVGKWEVVGRTYFLNYIKIPLWRLEFKAE
jgi:hypothetical protein